MPSVRRPMIPPQVRKFFEETGRRGGRSGTGAAKVRGDRQFYSDLSKKKNPPPEKPQGEPPAADVPPIHD